MLRPALLILALATALPASPLDAADPAAQPLTWNLFLSDWQILGPFPKQGGDPSGSKTEIVEDEANLRGGQALFYGDTLYAWKRYNQRIIAFRQALQANGATGDDAVAYAWTRFTSPTAQKAVLAVGYDDCFVAWVNGREVCRGEDNWASSLDQQLGEAELRAGENTLLLKVGNGTRNWDAAARFRPAGIREPLLAFRCEPAGNIFRLPSVDVTLLDSDRRLIAEHRCSGSRKSWPGIGGYYSLYATMPETTPAFVRFSFKEPGLRALEETVPWNQARAGDVVLQLTADRPTELLVVDRATGRPIADAQIWTAHNKEEQATDIHGRVSLPDLNVMAGQCWVAAAGYAVQTVPLKWPRGPLQRVQLTAGGRTLHGTVVSTSGDPLSGAKVFSGLNGGYSPNAITDEEGRFKIHGLPESQTTLYPVIECRGYVTKERFPVRLDRNETHVRWTLSPAAEESE